MSDIIKTNKSPLEKQMRILLVDDDRRMRELFKFEIASLGHEVIEAVDGRDALSKIFLNGGEVDTSIDAIVTDLQMPEMTGEELVDHLGSWGINTPCLLHTSGSMGGTRGHSFVTFRSKNDPNHVEKFLEGVEASRKTH